MQNDLDTKLLRNVAASGLARDICGEPPAWDRDPKFRVENLPVDEIAWHCVLVVADVAVPGSSAKVKAPFIVWMADGNPVSVHAVLERDPTSSIACSLMDAMTAPVLDGPRRPRLVLMENDRMADALRNAPDDVGHDFAGLIDIAVEPDSDTAELAQDFVQIQADAQAD